MHINVRICSSLNFCLFKKSFVLLYPECHTICKNACLPHLHLQEEEFYVCIYAVREGDIVLFHHEGGVEVGDVDAKAQKLTVAVNEKISEEQVKEQLLSHVPEDKKG